MIRKESENWISTSTVSRQTLQCLFTLRVFFDERVVSEVWRYFLCVFPLSGENKISKLVDEKIFLCFSRMLFTEWQFWSKKNKYSISGIYIIKKDLWMQSCAFEVSRLFVGHQHCSKALLVDSSLLNFVDKVEIPSSCNQISREQNLNINSRTFGHQGSDKCRSFLYEDSN